MRQFLLAVSGVTLFLSTLVTGLWAQSPSRSLSAESNLTLDEAIAAIQSKEKHSGSSFRLIRELDSTPTMRIAARRSVDAASSDHVALYDNGIFVALMRTGGFVILETDNRSDTAISLHLVSQTADGRVLTESNPVQGEVRSSVAQALAAESANVVDVLFATPINANAFESRFEGGRFPNSHNLDDDGTNNLFAIPDAVEKVGVDQSDVRELAVLVGTINTWPIRYALSRPIFPADPAHGLEAGFTKLVALSKEFALGNPNTLDIDRLLQGLRSIRNAEQLQTRSRQLKAFNEFLEIKLSSPDTSTFSANRSISTIPLKLGFYGSPDDSYAVMTVSGIIVAWKVSSNGTPALTRIGIAGD